MGHKYAEIAFTQTVKQVQSENNSRQGYEGMERGGDYNHFIGPREANFIEQRDSFYMASVSETEWPYVQHRGGPAGFLKVIDAKTLGFADYSGNRQYVSTGNFRNNDRVSLILVDYPTQTRMKIMGRISVVELDDHDTLEQLAVEDYQARVERGFLIHLEGFDWNCPQHITPRYTVEQIQEMIKPLIEENEMLKAERSTNTAPTNTTLMSSATHNDNELGDGPLPLIITGVRQLTPRVRAYELRDVNGGQVPKIESGAHIQLPVKLENGEVIHRHYSICSNPNRRDMYEVAILKEDNGKGGSIALHDNLQLGQVLNCSQPENHFELHQDNRPAVLMAAGIGITPIKSMAQSLKMRGTPLQLHYAGRSHTQMAFQDRITREFGDDLSIYSSELKQRMDIASIIKNAAADAVFYVCGPLGLINQVLDVAQAANISAERIRFERFNADISTSAKAVTVHLQRSNVSLEVKKDETILDAMLDAGIHTPYSCKTGACKSCVVKVIEGEADHKDMALSEEEKTQQKLMCPCVSRAVGKSLTLDI